ncbi:MAG: GDYXXLXY domain-containing protein [Tenacibaculum sp.]|nr:GDYXXLXY domain-containing protein [Tenacibaculum sp.]
MRNKLILGAIITQVIFLLGMIVYGLAPLFFGEEIKLKVSLYDPRDLLRGNYVKLDYNFGKPKNDSWYGKTVYAILEKDSNNIYKLKEVVKEKPDNGIYLKGKQKFRYDFGIDAYFMPKDKALQMEKDLKNSDSAYAIVCVMKGGAVRIKDIEFIPKLE